LELFVPSVLLDALDLFFNQRRIRWSWSSRPFPHESTPPPSIASALAKTLLKFMVLDASHYVLHLMSPSVTKTGGGSIALLPHTVTVALATFVGGLWVCTRLELTDVPRRDVDRTDPPPPTSLALALRSSADRGWRRSIPGFLERPLPVAPALATRFRRVRGPVVRVAHSWDGPARSFSWRVRRVGSQSHAHRGPVGHRLARRIFCRDVGFFVLVGVEAVL